MFDLTGKCALVTGASGGIGEAIAAAMHAQGATVALSGTRREKLDELAAKLGSRVHVLPCDLRDRAQVAALIGQAEAAMGQVDILVNNAGVTKDNLFMRMKDEEWDDVLAINLTSAFILCRAALRNMMRRRNGRIVNIASISGVFGNPGQGNYAASKAGLDRHDQVARARGGVARHYGQLHRAGLHRNADDACAQRKADGSHRKHHSGGHVSASRETLRRRRCSSLARRPAT